MVRTVRLSPTVSIPQLGYGAMGLSQGYGKADDDTSRETLRHAIKIGYTLWNTASVYGADQHNEKLLGSVLREGDNRSKVLVTTKWGVKWENGAMVVDGSPEYARQCIDQSIENLGSAPDMWLLHRIDKKVPVEESVKAMEEARQAGKCKYIGLSAMSANTLRRAAKVAKIDFVEVEFSPFETSIEESGVIDACKELGVKIFAYSPLGHGFLTGRFRSFEDVQKDGDVRGAGAFPRLSKEVWDHNFKLVEAFEKLAEKKGCKPSQLVLAWIMTVHGDLIIPIPGTKSIKYLEENFASNEVVLSQAEMDEIRQIIKENPIKGAQYNEKNLAMLDE